jgi:hypothetical protein
VGRGNVDHVQPVQHKDAEQDLLRFIYCLLLTDMATTDTTVSIFKTRALTIILAQLSTVVMNQVLGLDSTKPGFYLGLS